jgi:hypothetical protein
MDAWLKAKSTSSSLQIAGHEHKAACRMPPSPDWQSLFVRHCCSGAKEGEESSRQGFY